MPSEADELDMLSDIYKPGWVDDEREVAAIMDTQPFPVFGDTPAGSDPIQLPDSVLGWKLHEKVTGKPWPSGSQGNVGSCVSWGTRNGATLTMLAQIVAGTGEEFADVAQEPIYALSRVEIGKRRLGRGDGSVGAWAAEALKTFGVIKRGVYGSIDLTKYSEARCKYWGWSGLPDELEPIAKQRPIKAYSKVSSVEECQRALAQGYGINVCSNQGFRLSRDSDGFCAPRGTWAHSMSIIGYQLGNRPGFFILNSWGADAYSGPMGLGDGPGGGFWAEASIVERMLKYGDSYCYSSLNGFPAQHPDFYF